MEDIFCGNVEGKDKFILQNDLKKRKVIKKYRKEKSFFLLWKTEDRYVKNQGENWEFVNMVIRQKLRMPVFFLACEQLFAAWKGLWTGLQD